MSNRRTFLQSAFALGATWLPSTKVFSQTEQNSRLYKRIRQTLSGPASSTPVITTDIGDLPHTMDGNTKVFHLVAEVVKQQIHPMKTVDLWGFNGSAPGPTIQVNQGDHVRVIFQNHLPEPTSMHWHGFEDTIVNDGMPGISQPPVKPGERFIYEFDIHQEGTYFYHSHMAMQEMAGMLGAFIMHPKEPYRPYCDKDFLIHLQEYAVLPNNTVPNTMSMEFNWLTFNGKAGPATTPLIVRLGDRVRIRFVNLGMDHHPLHLHGHTFYTTGTEGGRIPESAWWPGNTVLVGVAQARDVEFVASNPGDWMIHCHLPHHMMNQMSSVAGKMTRTAGIPAGGDMNTGMGMLQGEPGGPMGDDYGPTLGRGLGGVGNAIETSTRNGPLSQQKAIAAMRGMQKEVGTMQMGAAQGDIARNANDIPNFPQDAYMEGSMMMMDEAVERPENFGLNAGWSGFMQGMMTFVRVLPAEKYDAVIARMKMANRPNDPYAAILKRA
jgi:manganese oxidase